MPFLYYNIVITSFATIFRLGARSLEITKGSSISEGILNRTGKILLWVSESKSGISNLFPGRAGTIIFLLVLVSIIYGSIKLIKEKSPYGKLVLFFLLSLILFNFLGNLTRPRHWCTLFFALIPAGFGLRRNLYIFLITILLIYTSTYIFSELSKTSPDYRVRIAASLITRHNSDLLIADYDLGYPIGFELKGSIPVAAIAPPNPSDRRPEWTESGKNSKVPAILLPYEKLVDFLSYSSNEMKVEVIGDRVLLFPNMTGAEAITIVKRLK